jgi:hypothetical protein
MQRNLQSSTAQSQPGPWWEWAACERHSLLEWALAKKQKEKEKGEGREGISIERVGARHIECGSVPQSSELTNQSKVKRCEQRAAKGRGTLGSERKGCDGA